MLTMKLPLTVLTVLTVLAMCLQALCGMVPLHLTLPILVILMHRVGVQILMRLGSLSAAIEVGYVHCAVGVVMMRCSGSSGGSGTSP